MKDEGDKTKDQGGNKSPASEKKPYVNPLNMLTPGQWKEAMAKGLEDSKNQSACVRRDMTTYY